MDVLVALGSSAAYFSQRGCHLRPGAGHEGFITKQARPSITLIRLGKYLEYRAPGARASRSAGQPVPAPSPHGVRGPGRAWKDAWRWRRSGWGTWWWWRPGERAPVDGVVRQGRSEFDESLVTGESDARGQGARGRPGCRHAQTGTGSVRFEASKVGRETTMAPDRGTGAGSAADQGAPSNGSPTQIGAVFVPSVVLIALATFGGWIWVANAGWMGRPDERRGPCW